MTKWYCDSSLVNPRLKQKIDAGFAKLNADGIVNACVTRDGGKRTDAMQIAMHAQGRQSLIIVNNLRKKAWMPPISEKENAYTITDCDGVHSKSQHQLGDAGDIVPMDKNGNPYWPKLDAPEWRIIATAMGEQGLRWGGDWNSDGRTRSDGDLSEKYIVDYPHHELKGA